MRAACSIEAILAFVEEHGVVLASAKGPVPRLIEKIAGETITGNWWSHPRAHAIYNLLAVLQQHDDILVCRLVNGKVTLVHRRAWPALVRLAGRFEARQIARVTEEHTAKGHHISRETPFPDWVPADVTQAAKVLDEVEARRLLDRWLPSNALADVQPSRRRPRANVKSSIKPKES